MNCGVFLTIFFGILFFLSDIVHAETIPPYVKQCYEGDPEVIQCFKNAIHHLRFYLGEGIPEIKLPSVEPFRMPELSFSLTNGPNGYRISLLDIDVYGASNFTVQKLKLSENGEPFETRIDIPVLKISSRYQSSGVLIILPASGNGTFNGQFENVSAIVRGKTSLRENDGVKFLHVDSLDVHLGIKRIEMTVKDIYKNNPILTQAINLFLREYGMEIYEIMLHQLKEKLAALFMDISNIILDRLALDVFYVPISKQTRSNI